MFVPPYRDILLALGIDPTTEDSDTVSVPLRFLQFLLRSLLAHTDFDEQGYREAHSDVRTEIAAGRIASGHDHFIHYGYFEGRPDPGLRVDEAWYLAAFPDVQAAVARGELGSATAHYLHDGAHEWRPPNPEAQAAITAWLGALGTEAAELRRLRQAQSALLSALGISAEEGQHAPTGQAKKARAATRRPRESPVRSARGRAAVSA